MFVALAVELHVFVVDAVYVYFELVAEKLDLGELGGGDDDEPVLVVELRRQPLQIGTQVTFGPYLSLMDGKAELQLGMAKAIS